MSSEKLYFAYGCLLNAALLIFAPAPPPTESLSGECRWGTLTQTGRNIEISGGTSWRASGSISKGGTVILIWTLGDRQAYGAYTVVGDTLVGVWGWDSESQISGDDVCGDNLHAETFSIRMPR